MKTTIHPSSLTTGELLKFAEQMLHEPGGLPLEWQKELIERFSKSYYKR